MNPRDTLIAALAFGLFVFACARIDTAAMDRCLEQHSFDTCHGALNR